MSEISIDAIVNKLTIRRRQVLEQLLLGASDSDIATTLDISEPTVRKHIERICEFFAQHLPEQQQKTFKRADLIRLIVGEQPKLTLPPNKLKEEAQRLNREGYEEYQKGSFTVAERYFQAAIDFDPDSSAAHYNLGMIFEMLRQIDKAKEQYEIASRLKGDGKYGAICNLARLSILDGKPEESILILQHCLSDPIENVPTQVSIQKNLGWAFYILGQYDQALEHLKQAIALSPSSTASHCLMAQVFEEIGDIDQAKECWRNCLSCAQLSKQTPDAAVNAWQAPELEAWQAQAFHFFKTHSE